MAYVFAIANQKGGVGKTTTVASLAACATGARVLIVDLDPHASLTLSFGLERPDAGAGSHRLLRDGAGLAEEARPTGVGRIDVIPAAAALATLEREHGRSPGMGRRLATLCRTEAAAYDWVLVDSPPTLGMLMINAVAAADYLIIPTQPDVLSRHGVDGMVRTVAMIDRTRDRPTPYPVVTTFYDRRTRASREGYEALCERHGDRLWPHVVPIDTQFREAAARAELLPLTRSSSRGAEAYRQLWDELTGELADMPPCDSAVA